MSFRRFPPETPNYCDRQGERSLQLRSAAVAHAVVLSVWQRLQAFGIFIVSVCVGQTKRKVWLRTITSPRVSAIFGMWQAMHSLPVLPRGVMGMLLDRGGMRPILRVRSVAAEANPIPLLAHHPRVFGAVRIVTIEAGDAARIHQALTKSLPCMRFLCAVPSGKCVKLVSPSLCSSSCQKSARFNPT